MEISNYVLGRGQSRWHVDDIADEILKLTRVRNRIKAEVYKLESKRKESFYPSKKRGILYKRVKYLRSFL